MKSFPAKQTPQTKTIIEKTFSPKFHASYDEIKLKNYFLSVIIYNNVNGKVEKEEI